MAKKTYRGAALDVTFDLEVCTHAGICVGGLPAVFDTDRRPWILPDEADAQAVRDTVARCPSGALGILEKPVEEQVERQGGEAAAARKPVQVRVAADGPLLVAGDVTIVDADGAVIREASKMALCRCGLSAAKPFCDGAHAREGWTG